ncbi:MAG: hypothetical protein AB7E75_03460 [Candidatus Methanomethylophilaceae archaeon]
MITFSDRWYHHRALDSRITADPRYEVCRKPARTYRFAGRAVFLFGIISIWLSMAELGILYTAVGAAVMLVTDRWSFWVKTDILMS